MLIIYGVYLRWARKQLPKPEMLQVVVSKKHTKVSIRLNTVIVDTQMLHRYDLSMAKVDGHEIIEQLKMPMFELDKDGKIIVELPSAASSKISLSGLLRVNGYRFILSCSFLKSSGHWDTESMEIISDAIDKIP